MTLTTMPHGHVLSLRPAACREPGTELEDSCYLIFGVVRGYAFESFFRSIVWDVGKQLLAYLGETLRVPSVTAQLRSSFVLRSGSVNDWPAITAQYSLLSYHVDISHFQWHDVRVYNGSFPKRSVCIDTDKY
jgi:hypothetical protein